MVRNRFLSFILSLLLVFALVPDVSVFAVDSVLIEDFSISFVAGATYRDGTYVWDPTDPAKGHVFRYRLDYALSGTFTQDKAVLQFELPLHILKDRNGNWADTFDCSYKREDFLSDGEEPDFVYEVRDDKVVIYNYKPYSSGTAGFIEFAYVTDKSTLEYVDMQLSADIDGVIRAIGSDRTVTKTAQGPPVCIDTHAELSSVKKGIPSLHETWDNSWGDRPADADDYLYLTWCVTSVVSKITQPYDFSLSDVFFSLGGSVVGYRFSGQGVGYKSDSVVHDCTNYGTRYDYVLTRHSKAQAEALLSDVGRYEVTNVVTANVIPVDGVDPVTSEKANRSWWFEVPAFGKPTGHFWVEKYGLYNGRWQVVNSENATSYVLDRLQVGFINKIDGISYHAYVEGYPYPWTLGSGAVGNESDALNGLYGQKKVDYEFIDDAFYLEDSSDPLHDDDYDLTGVSFDFLVRDARYDSNLLKFVETGVSRYSSDDAVSVFAKVNGAWEFVGKYDLATHAFVDINNDYVSSVRGLELLFKNGVKGIKFTCSNAYYHTKIDVYPTLTLYRTQNVLSYVDGKSKVKLTNHAVGFINQDNSEIFSRFVTGTDYLCSMNRKSELKKDITKVQNDRLHKKSVVTWRSVVHEDTSDGNMALGIPQVGGTFYDLLPIGGLIDKSSIEIKASGTVLSEGSYDITYIENWRESGRILMTVSITAPTDRYYELSYDTVHSWESVQDYGRYLLNSVAYESGNAFFTEGKSNDGGEITDKTLMSELSSNSHDVFLYAEARYGLDALLAGSTGLTKMVNGPYDSEYSYDTITNQNGSYSYQVRYANDMMSSSKDLVFFDSLESFYQKESEQAETIRSDWKGTLTNVDVTQMRNKGIDPVVYFSRIDGMNLYGHHNLAEVMDGESVWMTSEDFLSKYDLSDAHAVAVDASKGIDGSDYVLDPGDSVVFKLYMRAPDSSNVLDGKAYNNIFVERSVIRESGDLSQFFHQDYTQIMFRSTGNVVFKKVDSIDMESAVSGSVFLLRGTSKYGTEYYLSRTSDIAGYVSFRGIEPGDYELVETNCDADWQLNTEVYRVCIDDFGNATLDCDVDPNGEYVIPDDVRVHTDFMFIKTDAQTGNNLDGAKFRLFGTSEYGNDVLMYAESVDGRVIFPDVELGTYTLSEVQAPDGYVSDKVGHVVKIDEKGKVTVTRSGKELGKNASGYYVMKNDKVHTVRFVKSSSYGDNLYLGGAVFNLSGVSDYGTDVDLNAVSSDASDGGLVVFEGLEPGHYVLKELEAPSGHALDMRSHEVVVGSDGSFIISGVSQTQIGSATVYDFKNVKQDGTVEIIKRWVDDKTNGEREIPAITISTNAPKRSLLGITVRYDANGGAFANGKSYNDVIHGSSGAVIAGDVVDPSIGNLEYSVFTGWYTTPLGGNLVSVNNNIPDIDISDDVTLYAHWESRPRYVVSVWDIAADVDQYGDAMGLTFGPALGQDYRNSFVSHDPSGVTADGNEYRCLHDDTWSDVVCWNRIDPWVYDQCIENGCTKAIPLDYTGLEGGTNVAPTYYGEGVSSFGVTCNIDGHTYDHLHYNGIVTWDDDKQLGTERAEAISGGWGASRLRAIFNGCDELTNQTFANGTYGDSLLDVVDYDADNCLLNCFPDVLRNAIGAKAVSYGTRAPTTWVPSIGVQTSYDKLWVPSVANMCDSLLYYNKDYDVREEGHVYRKWLDIGTISKGEAVSDFACVGYRYSYMRTIATGGQMYLIGTSGSLTSSYGSAGLYGYSPCFALSR